VARAETLLRYPRVRHAIEALAGRIAATDMQAMNYAADALHEDPAAIARRFLTGK
jgi:glycine betaine/choline ABC-type transport system substrate-binding protein